MGDIRQAIVSLDHSLKLLDKHFDSSNSVELRNLNEQINQFEKRWAQLIDSLEQCSKRVRIHLERDEDRDSTLGFHLAETRQCST